MARKYIIFASSFHEDIGGVIALHRLCDLLNYEGQTALLWPDWRPIPNRERPLYSVWQHLRYRHRLWRRPYQTYPRFNTPLATPADLFGAIAVYPEVVDGNPLGADHVVRWLLHKPGFHTGRYEYGPKDRFFFWGKPSDDPALNPDGDNLLRTLYLRDDVYKQTNSGPRRGSCYILRKGKGRPLVHDLGDSVLVDAMSHTELAEVFNQVETCISYDTYTMYSQFAALCGCLSIIVPEDGVTKEQWHPDPKDRYGLAYGFDDLNSATQTRRLLLPHLKAQTLEANDTVKSFIAKCEAYFPE